MISTSLALSIAMCIQAKADYRDFRPPIAADERLADRVAGLERRHPSIHGLHAVTERIHAGGARTLVYRCRLLVVLGEGDAAHWGPVGGSAHEDFFIALHKALDDLEIKLAPALEPELLLQAS